MLKTIYTLNIDNHNKEVTDLTFPYIQRWADKIGAKFEVISERKFPDFPITYEKLQIYELGKDNDWNIYIDSDALVHLDMFDPTEVLSKDTVMGLDSDFAPVRWKYDKYFQRDGRHIGVGNWFTVSSNLCHDLWRPLNGLTPDEALSNIFPIKKEEDVGITKEHLIDDYTLSRNLARFGLKFKSLKEILEEHNTGGNDFFFHQYLLKPEKKVIALKSAIANWKI